MDMNIRAGDRQHGFHGDELALLAIGYFVKKGRFPRNGPKTQTRGPEKTFSHSRAISIH
jgi:hypothetical protein